MTAQAQTQVPSTDARTRLLAVLGHPVGHSISPTIHSAAIAAVGLNAVYVALDVPPESLDTVLDGLVAAGFLGANVTIPHKAAALAYCDAVTEEARFIGAANTLYWDGDRLTADNTDAAGLLAVLREDCAITAIDTAVVFGSGGAARAAVVALGRLGAGVRVQARRPEAAAALQALARDAGAASPAPGPARLVINATPLGRHGESLPEELMTQGSGQVAVDLNYATRSPFLTGAAAQGALAVDGTGMLIRQAEASFARWTGQPPPQGVMSAAVP